MQPPLWNHNTHYHRLILRLLPPRCERVLDVGCGAGAFATRLAERSDRVDAVDSSAEMIAEAARRTPAEVTCIHADILLDPPDPESYDAICSLSALHHMPLEDALRTLSAALRPGGMLVAIALPRTDLPRELPVEAAALLAERIVRAGYAVRRAFTGRRSVVDHAPTMPTVMDPPLTTRQVADLAASVLPGSRVRRLLFWRYLLVWRKPRP